MLDDVWHSADVQSFHVAGSSSKVLFTTREADFKGSFGVELIYLDGMSEEECVSMVTQKLDHQLELEEEVELKLFAKSIGYLPLALDLAKNLIPSVCYSWKELREVFETKLDKLIQKLRSTESFIDLDEKEERKCNFQACFDVSWDRMIEPKELQLQQKFIWLGILPKGIEISRHTVESLWGVDQIEARSVLNFLQSRAFLIQNWPVSNGEYPTYRIHDLLHAMAQKKIKEGDLSLPDMNGYPTSEVQNLQLAHKFFLESCGLGEKEWWLKVKIYKDDYILENLIYHLTHSQLFDELLEVLIRSNKWMKMKSRKYGNTNFYLREINSVITYLSSLNDFQAKESLSLEKRISILIRLITLKAWLKKYKNNSHTPVELSLLVWLNKTSEALSYASYNTSLVDEFQETYIVHSNLIESNKHEDSLITLQKLTEIRKKMNGTDQKGEVDFLLQIASKKSQVKEIKELADQEEIFFSNFCTITFSTLTSYISSKKSIEKWMNLVEQYTSPLDVLNYLFTEGDTLHLTAKEKAEIILACVKLSCITGREESIEQVNIPLPLNRVNQSPEFSMNLNQANQIKLNLVKDLILEWKILGTSSSCIQVDSLDEFCSRMQTLIDTLKNERYKNSLLSLLAQSIATPFSHNKELEVLSSINANSTGVKAQIIFCRIKIFLMTDETERIQEELSKLKPKKYSKFRIQALIEISNAFCTSEQKIKDVKQYLDEADELLYSLVTNTREGVYDSISKSLSIAFLNFACSLEQHNKVEDSARYFKRSQSIINQLIGRDSIRAESYLDSASILYEHPEKISQALEMLELAQSHMTNAMNSGADKYSIENLRMKLLVVYTKSNSQELALNHLLANIQSDSIQFLNSWQVFIESLNLTERKRLTKDIVSLVSLFEVGMESKSLL